MNDHCIKTEHKLKIIFSNLLKRNSVDNGMPFILLRQIQ
jgi:hypothetical protein